MVPRKMFLWGFIIVLCFFSVLLSGLAVRMGPQLHDGEILRSREHIFDTSNYGRLQLNNGLGRTPQMGYNWPPPPPYQPDFIIS